MSIDLMEKVNLILEKVYIPDRHSYFQIEKFIIGKEPTVQAQLWAIARELQVRKETVENYTKDLSDAEDNLELFDLQIERLNRMLREKSDDPYPDLAIQEKEITIRKIQREKEDLIKAARKVNHRLKSVLEEINCLVSGFETIIAQVGDVKSMDDLDAQKEMWNEKLLEDFNLRIIFQRPFDPEFVKTILCLHDDSPVKLQMSKLLNHMQARLIDSKKDKNG